jgi:hypothetical protein
MVIYQCDFINKMDKSLNNIIDYQNMTKLIILHAFNNKMNMKRKIRCVLNKINGKMEIISKMDILMNGTTNIINIMKLITK